MAKRKIELMHSLFGMGTNICKNCLHFQRYQYRAKSYSKCDVYGDTRSEATDWTGKYVSCGMFGKEYTGKEVVRVVQPTRTQEDQMPGQMSLFGE